MSSDPKRHEPEDLAVPEKILRVQDLWDDIARSPREVELTPAQREEAERRLSRHEEAPGEYSLWEQIKRRLQAEP